jgi:hypothetical protein
MQLITSNDKTKLINLSQVQLISFTKQEDLNCVDYEFQPENGEANYYRERFDTPEAVDKRLEQLQKINSFINAR